MCQSATVGSKIWSCAQICLHVCVSLCVYKAALDGYWGRRWPDRCVCLGSGSAFHIPLWYSVLWPQETHPAKKCARSRSLPPSDCSLSFLPPPHISVSLSPFLWIIYSTLFFSICRHGKSSVNPQPVYNSNSPSLLLPEVPWWGNFLTAPNISCCQWQYTTLHFVPVLNISLKYVFLLFYATVQHYWL